MDKKHDLAILQNVQKLSTESTFGYPDFDLLKKSIFKDSICPEQHVSNIWWGCTLWLFNSLPWYRWPIKIDGLPINSMVIFHSYVSHNQMVDIELREVGHVSVGFDFSIHPAHYWKYIASTIHHSCTLQYIHTDMEEQGWLLWNLIKRFFSYLCECKQGKWFLVIILDLLKGPPKKI